jgi:hypothetical protein
MSDYIIPVRSNLYLWLLTGRSDDFFNEALNTGVNYSISDTPAEVKEARQILHLNNTETDFFVLAALAAVKMSTSFIRTMPHENDAVFVEGFLALPPVTSSVPLLPSTAHSWPSIDGGKAGQHGFTRLVIRSLGNGKAQLTTDSGIDDSSDYSLADNLDGTFRLAISKAEDYGVRANFKVKAWDLGSEVSIKFSPTRYPFGAVATAARDNSTTRRLMIAEGVMQAFSETSNSATKVGLLSIAVIRRMLRHINEDQVGFSVTANLGMDGLEPEGKTYFLDPVFTASLYTPVIDADSPEGFNV